MTSETVKELGQQTSATPGTVEEVGQQTFVTPGTVEELGQQTFPSPRGEGPGVRANEKEKTHAVGGGVESAGVEDVSVVSAGFAGRPPRDRQWRAMSVPSSSASSNRWSFRNAYLAASRTMW